ncbi:oxidoreductase [candidate division KSB3 bacterium]|uniref:Oxidoreductase n=1 Tax=candidate division KSB3 bacterium TaxID=2044937 RepID=A0A2G6K927_9BACT|nr:MAG: oxidoreductase [candidate division KSB3 bacterium]
MKKVRIGVIGCGNISSIYLENCPKASNMEVVACADLLLERAKAQAEKFSIPRACAVDELLADESIQIIVNLTIPNVHAEVNCQILEAGKHAYVEKPLAATTEKARNVLEFAKSKDLLVGGAPDTFMGAGFQTCRKVIDDGWIGKPIAATAFMMCHGHEHWHPDPAFYYQTGGGPMFDMGPYYLTALIHLLGPVKKVSGMTQMSFPERTISSEPKFGQTVTVEVPTHINGMMEFETGATVNIITSFDVWSHDMPFIEIYGTEGTLRCPDPNTFGGDPMLKRGREEEWSVMPLSHGFAENSRGIGIANMANAVRNGGSFRAQGALAFHVLDIMQSLHASADNGEHLQLDSQCEQPEPMPMNMNWTTW